ncbi:hypothetical protein EHW64_04890 [Erwinia psidii]|nr:hypothetical protein [Erwinia psidii]MCX8960520.1 hypothetical protein [Erwinia psidii]
MPCRIHRRYPVLIVIAETLRHRSRAAFAPRHPAKAVERPARPLQPLQQVMPHHLARTPGLIACRIPAEVAGRGRVCGGNRRQPEGAGRLSDADP